MAKSTSVTLKLKTEDKDVKSLQDKLKDLQKQILSMVNEKIDIKGDASGAIDAVDKAQAATAGLEDEEVLIDGDGEDVEAVIDEVEDSLDGLEDEEIIIEGDGEDAISAVEEVQDAANDLEDQTIEIEAETSAAEDDISSLQDLAISAATVIGGTLSAGMFFDLSSNIDDIAKYSASMNILTQDYVGLQRVSTLYGLSEQDLQKTLTKNQNAVTEATLGNSKFTDMYDRLGVSIYDANGKVKDSTAIFEETTKAIDGISDSSEQQLIANELFGKSYTSINKIMDGGVDAFWEQADAFSANTAMTEETAGAFEEMNDKMSLVKDAFIDAKTNALAPFTKAITYLAETALALLTGETSDLTDSQKTLYSILDTLAPLLITLGAALGTFAIAVGVITLATTIWGAVSSAAAIAIGILTSPITIVIGVIALLGVAIYKLLEKMGLLDEAAEVMGLAWEALKVTFERVMNAIAEVVGVVMTWIKDKFSDELQLIIDAFNFLKEKLTELFSELAQFFQQIIDGDFKAAWETFKQIIMTVLEIVVGLMKRWIEFIWSVFTNLLSIIAGFFASIWEKFKQIVKNAIDSAVNWIKSLPGKFIEMVTNVANNIKTKWNEAWASFKQITKDRINDAISMIKSIPGKMGDMISSFKSIISSKWSDAWSAFKQIPVTALNAVISGVESGMNSVINGAISGLNAVIRAGNKVPGVNLSEISSGGVSLPRVPYFAKGGIVDGAGLGVVGEAGPEMILPLNSQGADFFDKIIGKSVGEGVGGNIVNVNVQGDMVAQNPEELRTDIMNDIDEYLGKIYA